MYIPGRLLMAVKLHEYKKNKNVFHEREPPNASDNIFI